jgi:putative transposase
MASPRYHNIYEDNAICFWTSAVVARIPLFTSATASRVLIELLQECRTRCRVKLLGYVIMPDHIHLAVWSEKADNVRRFLRLFLGMSSAGMVQLAEQAADRGNATAAGWLAIFRARAGKGKTARVWKERGRAFPVTQTDGLLQKLNYMHENPVRAELVALPEDWIYSSAAWYLRRTGPLAIDSVDL